MRHFRTALLLVLIALLLAVPAPGPALGGPDLFVDNVEVIQAVQTVGNTVPLVAQRSTAVRATIDFTGSGVPVAGVTGRLHVFVGAVEITPAAGVLPINAPFTAPVSPDRDNENDTLNFELAAPTGITASTNVDFRVDITPVPGETNTGNNSGTAADLEVVNRRAPLIYFTRINYTPGGLGLPPLSKVEPGVGDAFVKGIFPVDDSEPTLYQVGIFPSLSFDEDADGNGEVDGLTIEGDELLNLLDACRQLIVDDNVGAEDRIFLTGWLNGHVGGNGLAQVGGRLSFQNTEDIRYQRSFAHELDHNFGAVHNSDLTNEVGWDVTARLVDNPAGNNTDGRLKPVTHFDIMNPGRLTNVAWIKLEQHQALLDHPTLQPGLGDLDFRAVYIHGTIRLRFPPDPPGPILALRPAFRFPWRSEGSRVLGRESMFVARLTLENQQVIRLPFDAEVMDDERNMRLGAFGLVIPVPQQAQVRSLDILTMDEKTRLGGFQRSPLPPTLQITQPSRGQRLGRVARVAFRARDRDTPREQLMFQAAFSPDSGNDFVPIAVDLTKNGFSFDTTAVPPATRTGLIRVFASDGLNTSFADVGRLSTPRPRPR